MAGGLPTATAPPPPASPSPARPAPTSPSASLYSRAGLSLRRSAARWQRRTMCRNVPLCRSGRPSKWPTGSAVTMTILTTTTTHLVPSTCERTNEINQNSFVQIHSMIILHNKFTLIHVGKLNLLKVVSYARSLPNMSAKFRGGASISAQGNRLSTKGISRASAEGTYCQYY